MTHPQQLEFFKTVRTAFPDIFARRKVLEVGSLDVNGSVRGIFDECEYIGLDVAPGPGVDLVQQGQLLDLPSESIDVCVSTECMEHNPFWRETIAAMARVTKPSGLVLLTCALAGRPEHGTPRSHPGSSPLTVDLGWSYYRNLTPGMVEKAINLPGWFQAYGFWKDYYNRDLYFVGLRAPQSPQMLQSFDKLSHTLGRAQRASWKSRWKRDLAVRVMGDRALINLEILARQKLSSTASGS